MTSLIVFGVTLGATALSAMSGGGASTINLPVFLMLGMPFPLASATQKISSTLWVIPAGYNYLRGRKVDWIFVLVFSLLGLVGVLPGALLVVSVNEKILRMMVGVLILIFVAYTYLRKDLGLKERQPVSFFWRLVAYPFGILLGFYESIFGAGNAIAFTMLTVHTRGFDFIDAMGYYYAVSFSWCLATALFLAYRGYFDIALAVPAVLGSVIGGYLGSKLAVYKGNKFIKVVFVIIGGLLGLKLLIGW